MRNSAQRGHFRRVFRDNFWLEVANDVISGVAVEYVIMDVRLKLGDSRSNRSRDIRAAHFVMDDERRRRWPTDPVVIGQNAIHRFA